MSFFNAFAHPIPTAAIARPITVVRILVHPAIARDDYCIFVSNGRSQRGDALEPFPRNPPATVGAYVCLLCSITTRLPTDFERVIYASSDQGLLLAFDIHWSGRNVKEDSATIHSLDTKAAGFQYCLGIACPGNQLVLLARLF